MTPPTNPWSKKSWMCNKRRTKSQMLRQGRAAPLRYQRVLVQLGTSTKKCVVLCVQHNRVRVHTHGKKKDGVWYVRLCDEGVTWVRGHEGEVPDAFRAQVALVVAAPAASFECYTRTWTYCVKTAP